MDLGQKPDLSLDSHGAGRPFEQGRERTPLERLLWFLAGMSTLTVLIMAGLLIVVLLQLNRTMVDRGFEDAAALRAAAMELEDKGLDLQAAESWQDYLERAGNVEDRAALLYRAGKLYMKSQKYDEAVVCFVRAETEADATGDATLVEKIGPKLVACLEKMGRANEADRELSRRVEVGGEEKTGAILATIGDEKIRESDIERMTRNYVERFLAAQGLPPDSPARAQVEQQMSSPGMRDRIIQEAVQMELLERRAREQGLHEDPEYVEAKRRATEGLLQQFLLRKEFDKIETSATDLKNYFEAHKDRYGDAESADVLLVQFKPDEDPAAVLGKIKTADDFRRWFEERKKAGDRGAGKTTLRKGAELPPALTGVFDLGEGEWTKSPIELGPSKLALLVEKKNAAKPKTFAEAEPDVRRNYLAQKRQEMMGKLMNDLMSRYNVRILAGASPTVPGMPRMAPSEIDPAAMAPPGATIPTLQPAAPPSPGVPESTGTAAPRASDGTAEPAKAAAESQTTDAEKPANVTETPADAEKPAESKETDASPQATTPERDVPATKDSQPEENQP